MNLSTCLSTLLGINKDTPGYIVREGTKRDKIRVEKGKRSVKRRS